MAGEDFGRVERWAEFSASDGVKDFHNLGLGLLFIEGVGGLNHGSHFGALVGCEGLVDGVGAVEGLPVSVAGCCGHRNNGHGAFRDSDKGGFFACG